MHIKNSKGTFKKSFTYLSKSKRRGIEADLASLFFDNMWQKIQEI